jgi:hypothetical protein
MATKKKIGNIKWDTRKIKISDILPTPKNYKIKNDLGLQRLQTSLSDFGLAGSIVVNPDKKTGKYVLIDGNSRLQEAKDNKETHMTASIPSRPLSPKEFVDMCKMFDLAKAGDVDIKSIEAEGTTAEYFKKFGLEVPMHLLNNMGARAGKKDLQYPGNKSKKGGKEKDVPVNDVQMIQLFYTVKQAEEFYKMVEKLEKKFKTDNVHSTVFKALKQITK